MAISRHRLGIYVGDVAGLVAIVVVLAGVHYFVPPALQQALVFDHGQFRGYTLLTAAYIHASEAHFLQNLEGCLRIVGFPYVFSLVSHNRRWFWRTTLTLLLVLPVVTGVTSYVLLPVWYPEVTPITYGFSDIVAGVAGMLIVAVGRYMQARYGDTAAWAVSISGGLFVLILIGARLTGATDTIVTGGVGREIGIGAGLGVAIGLAGVLAGGWYLVQAHAQSAGRTWIGAEGIQETAILGVTAVVLGALLWDFFPPRTALAASDPTTNLVGHAAGLGWGLVLATAVVVLERR
ncbi:hypothetical protein [Halobellus sp. GM3]|uniref:hypothetical protein n=1 Tax=Halobellus sp. GM3 TaxID=3458410 RepID=UPI00403E1E0E